MLKIWLVWLLASYGCALLLTNLTNRWSWGYFSKNRYPFQVKLLLHNSQGSFEWIVRSLIQKSIADGRPVQIMVYDYGSTDNTQQMLKIIERNNPFLIYQVQENDNYGDEISPVYQQVCETAQGQGMSDPSNLSDPILIIDLREGSNQYWIRRYPGLT